MKTKSFGSNVQFSGHDAEQLAESWAPIVRKAVVKVLSDSDWATEVLADLIQDYSAGKFILDPNRNIDGYIYRAAFNRAKSILKRKILRRLDANCGVDDLSIYADEDRKSPAERLMWESRAEILEYSFGELQRVMESNGHVPNPKLAITVLKEYLLGSTLREIADRFQLSERNYPAVLKHRYLPVLRNIIRKAA